MDTSTQSNHFFQSIMEIVGKGRVNMMRDFLKTKLKVARAINKRNFLLRCRTEKIYSPSRSIKNTHQIDQQIFDRLSSFFIFSIINQEIKETMSKIKNFESYLNSLQLPLSLNISSDILDNFNNYCDRLYEKEFSSIKMKHINKINLWTKRNNNEIQSIDQIDNQNKWLVNLTNVDVPPNVQNTLALGKKFNPPSKIIPYEHIIAGIESAIYYCQENERNDIRNKSVNIITNFKNTGNFKVISKEDQTINRNVKSTKNFLLNNPSILVTNADKGNVTVLIDKNDYIEKMDLLLSDTNTYATIQKDNTKTTQKEVNTMVESWYMENKITLNERNKLKISNSVIAKMYGCPKIHKHGTPLRPIVSGIGTPTHELSAFLCNILKCSIGQKNSYVKNAEEFREKIKNLEIPANHIIISLDVVSLFTNVDTKLVTKIIQADWKNIKKNGATKLTKIQFFDALDLVLNSCVFAFNKKFYKQKFGAAMGSPVSPVVAEIIMEYIEELALNKLNFDPKFYYRYVDDIIMCIPADKIDFVVSIFNSINNNIKFTVERENHGQISFLDLLIIHDNNTIKTNWYHKPTWSGRYISFTSNLPLAYKINTISILTQKILKLSDREFHKNNFKLLVTTLSHNGYPTKIISREISKTIHKYRHSTQQLITNTVTTISPQKYIGIPYIKGLYHKLKYMLKEHSFTLVGYALKPLDRVFFSNLKDPIPKECQSSVVYEATCECGCQYIGITKQYLHSRFKQHIYDSKSKTNNSTTQKKVSALSTHLAENNHNITFDDFKIIEREANYRKRNILEMLHIKKRNNTMNKITDAEHIKSFYDNIIRTPNM